MTIDEIARRIRANEADTNRGKAHREILYQLERRQRYYDSKTVKGLLEILHHLWSRGTTPDSSVDAMATVEYMPVDISESRRWTLLNRLVSLGLVEEFRPVGHEHGRTTSCGQMAASKRRYRLSKTAVELYEMEE